MWQSACTAVFLTSPVGRALRSKGTSSVLAVIGGIRKGEEMYFIQLRNTYQASNICIVYKWIEIFAKSKKYPLYP